MTIHPTIAEIARHSRAPVVHLIAAIDEAEIRLGRMTADGKSPVAIAGQAAVDLGAIILAKRAYMESIGAGTCLSQSTKAF